MDLEDLLSKITKEQMEILYTSFEEIEKINSDEGSEFVIQDWMDFINDVKNR